jgi:flagellar protein FlaG
MGDIWLNLNTNVPITPGKIDSVQNEEKHIPVPADIQYQRNIIDDGRQDEKKYDDEKERKQLEESANAIFDSLNTGLALKFHERSGDWYAIIENKITHEVLKEIPPKYVLELRAQLRDMVGFFLDRKI